MRVFVAACLFRVAGHSVYGGVSGQISPFVALMFLIGFFVVPFILARLLT